ncbi:DUF2982 domain-containing protein [Saccharobesus litoralis]|uniref:DUF2982 domain-containing protein n=1 Tax=Saccharobesus litoralis TaxID=2172099 RepID=UPI00131ED8E0|nr:DUF2982 domain-containing protein [Saccharobesus litoralis]
MGYIDVNHKFLLFLIMRKHLHLVKPLTRANGFNLVLFSVAGLFVYLILSHLDVIEHKVVHIFWTLSIGICALIGVLKIFEPVVSCELDDTGFIYCHRKGLLKVRWADIRRVGEVSIAEGLENRALPFIGIKLIAIDNLLEETSLRVMSSLIVEQRALLTQIMSRQCQMGECIGEEILNTDPYKTETKEYKGVQAMFANQLCLLNKYAGYHIILAEGLLDRKPSEFIQLLKQYKNSHPIVD